MPSLTVDQALLRAKSHERKGELHKARELYEAVLRVNAKNKIARQALAALAGTTPVQGAAASPNPDKLRGLISLYNQGQFAAAAEKATMLVAEFPSSHVLWSLLGASHKGLGNLPEAEAGFRRVTQLNSNDPDAHYNLGMALKEQDKLDEAIAAFSHALTIRSDHVAAQINLGISLVARGKLDEAIAAYERALAIQPDNADALVSMGIALKEQGELEKAVATYNRALASGPDNAEAHANKGNALKEQGRLDEAIAEYRRALAIRPDIAQVHNNLGIALQEQGKLDEAIAAYQRALAIRPDYLAAEARLIHQIQHVCDWSNAAQLDHAGAVLGIATAAVPPFEMLSVEDDPAHQLTRSRKWASEYYKQTPLVLPARPIERPERLRIGYFSADFHDHATMYLMAGLLREHDATQFEILTYSYGRNKTGDWRDKAGRAADRFLDVADRSDRDIAEMARSHGLDIAVDLKGYTQHSRSGVFQFRLAPIQVNYLGYPGTMGADFIDYIIADRTVIPEDQRRFYSEKIIYLPHSYQPNDDARRIASSGSGRAECGLPDDAFVFCCFNNSYKIGMREFDIWMRLLAKFEGSILWLLKSNQWAEENLRREARARGVDPSRIVFAARTTAGDHLARHQHADLFIDTFHYNAHTTASDALWAGLPVVTKQGKQFAARVASSLLNAVRLPELVTTTDADYEALILDLATNRDRLAAIRARLAANRLTQPLFETRRYAINFESGMRQAYQLYLDGMTPRDILVQDEVARN